MTTSYGALCSDFYINQKFALKMDLPTARETVLDLFDRIRDALRMLAQRLLEPGIHRQMSHRKAHRLHDRVFGREMLAKARHDAPRLEILPGESHRRGSAVRFSTLRMATLELTRATPGSRVSSSLCMRSKSAMSATTTRSR